MRFTIMHHLLIKRTLELPRYQENNGIYLFSHQVNIRIWAVVHQGIGKHQINITLVFCRIVDYPIPNSILNRLQVHRAFYYVMIVRSISRPDRMMKYCTVTMRGNLRMHHTDDSLKAFSLFDGISVYKGR